MRGSVRCIARVHLHARGFKGSLSVCLDISVA